MLAVPMADERSEVARYPAVASTATAVNHAVVFVQTADAAEIDARARALPAHGQPPTRGCRLGKPSFPDDRAAAESATAAREIP